MNDLDCMNGINTLKKKVNGILLAHFNGFVQSGPFKGMFIPSERSWPDDNAGIMVLGCYEQELHDALEREISRLEGVESPKVVNIGCAEGYYAIGLARRLPTAQVYVYDINSRAIEIANWAAMANKCQIRSGDNMRELLDGADLIVSDCEGAETEYLSPSEYPSLSRASIIVECHDTDPDNTVSDLLIDRFVLTHHIERIEEGGRNPNEYEFLRKCDPYTKWLAVNEGRPFFTSWLYMVPR